MKVVVTGASGNIGTALLRALGPEFDVTGVTRRVPAAPGKARWVPVDIGMPGAEEVLAEAMSGADAVVHLAWLVQPSRDEKTLYRTNVAGSDRVFTAAARAGVPHLVHMSSVGAYSAGDKTRRVDEQWPVDGIHSSSYSRHKSAVEHLLDVVEREHPDLIVTRVRPGLVMQRSAATELKRYFLGPLVPTASLRLAFARRLPLLPLPRRMVLQFLHADDVADGLVRVLTTRLPGAVNLVAEPVIGPLEIADLVGARHIPIPAALLRAVAAVTWHLHAQPTSPGWVDLALSAPLLSAERARSELGWAAKVDARDVLRELLAGFADRDAEPEHPPLS
jgi:nucleoside-diphosphate-sugar epimerase